MCLNDSWSFFSRFFVISRNSCKVLGDSANVHDHNNHSSTSNLMNIDINISFKPIYNISSPLLYSTQPSPTHHQHPQPFPQPHSVSSKPSSPSKKASPPAPPQL